MSRNIHRYSIETVHETCAIAMPSGARFLYFAFQDPRRCFSVWVESDTEAVTLSTRKFIVLPTGAEVDQRLEYRGTTLVNGGDTVWHLYEARQPAEKPEGR